MIPNNRPLKAYVRYDGQGRVVSSSLILRKNKPKVGKWKEVQGYECCNPDVNPLSDIIITSEVVLRDCPTYITLSITPGLDFNVLSFTKSPSILFTTYEEVVQYLNDNYSFLGVFSFTTPNQVSLQVSTTAVPNFWLNIPSEDWEFNINTVPCP
jgi:hypothetical protein